MTEGPSPQDLRANGLRVALEYLASGLVIDHEAGLVLHALLAKLRAGNAADQQVAWFISQALTFPGSQGAQEAASALSDAVQTQQGRKAAGLPPKKRAPQYDPHKVTVDTAPFSIAVARAQGRMSEREALDGLVRYYGEDMDERSARALLRQVLPRARSIAQFLQEHNIWLDSPHGKHRDSIDLPRARRVPGWRVFVTHAGHHAVQCECGAQFLLYAYDACPGCGQHA